jgi:MFS family permease
MSASAVVGYALVADSGTLIIIAAVVGAVGAVIGGIVQAVLTNSSANKRQRREFQYRGGRKSSMTGPLFLIAAALAAVAIYVATRTDAPKPVTTVDPSSAESTTDSSVPITLDEASAFVISYLERGIREETEEQAWAMFTENHKLVFTRGLDGFRAFWRNVESVTPQEGSTLVSASATRAVLKIHLVYKLFKPNQFGVVCTDQRDTFTLVRVNSVLLIDEYAPLGEDCPNTPPSTSSS